MARVSLNVKDVCDSVEDFAGCSPIALKTVSIVLNQDGTHHSIRQRTGMCLGKFGQRCEALQETAFNLEKVICFKPISDLCCV